MNEFGLGVSPTMVAAIVGAVLGLSGLAIATYLDHRRSKLRVKRDVLRRVVGYRFRLVKKHPKDTEEPWLALNEIFIVFARDKRVVRELDSYWRNGFRKDRLRDLVRAMAEAAKVPDNFSDDFFDRPFTRNEADGESAGRKE